MSPPPPRDDDDVVDVDFAVAVVIAVAAVFPSRLSRVLGCSAALSRSSKVVLKVVVVVRQYVYIHTSSPYT